MRRYRNSPLRGSVTQNTVRVRARKPATTAYGLLVRLGMLMAAIIVMLGTVIWLWHIGWPQHEIGRLREATLQVTQDAKFAIRDVVVEGRDQTEKEAVIAALGDEAGTGLPILGFDPKAAQARIAKLPWVASATVERRLPATILVHLTERVPLARWQFNNHTVVIDAEGKELPGAKPEQFASLPLMVGADAPSETQNLLEALKKYPSIDRIMTAAVRVGERRWDLHLEPKIVARLPEKGVDAALKRLSELITEQKVLDRNISAIDLRLPDRLVIEPAGDLRGKAGNAKL